VRAIPEQGEAAYLTFAGQAAALTRSLARDPALADGNKRPSWAATGAFRLLNGRDLRFALDNPNAQQSLPPAQTSTSCPHNDAEEPTSPSLATTAANSAVTGCWIV
jgi:hypothetical protein